MDVHLEVSQIYGHYTDSRPKHGVTLCVYIYSTFMGQTLVRNGDSFYIGNKVKNLKKGVRFLFWLFKEQNQIIKISLLSPSYAQWSHALVTFFSVIFCVQWCKTAYYMTQDKFLYKVMHSIVIGNPVLYTILRLWCQFVYFPHFSLISMGDKGCNGYTFIVTRWGFEGA